MEIRSRKRKAAGTITAKNDNYIAIIE
jgi:hypothetical protein